MENNAAAVHGRRLGAFSAEKAEEAIFLSLLGGLIFYQTSISMMLNHYPPYNVELALRGGLILLAFRKAYVLGRRGEGKKLLLPGLISMGMLASYWSTGYELPLELALCILCAIDVPYRKILRVYLAVAIVCLAAGISGGFMDLCTQLSYLISSRNVSWRHSFGSVYPTDFAAHIVFILLALWACARRPHYFRMLLLALAALVLQLKLTATRCSEIICALFALCILYEALAEHFAQKKWLRVLDGGMNWGITAAMPLLAILTITATALYTAGEPFWEELNTLVSSRLQIGQQGLTNYGITLFGTAFDMYGNGWSITTPEGYNYFFLDSSYILLPVRYGAVVLLGLLAIYVVVVRRAAAHGYRRLSQAFFLVAIACVIEQHALELAYNPLVLLAFVNFRAEEQEPAVQPSCRERRTSDIVWLLLAALLAAALPWLWSYGKTAVNVLVLEEAATRTVPAQVVLFLFVTAAGALLWALYRLFTALLNRRNPKKALIAALAALLAVGSTLGWTEYQLSKNTYRYSERLERSKELVEVIQNAGLPCSIRVADIPELYRREMEGTQNQLLPTYTASTDAKNVVIFTGSTVEHENYLLSSGYNRYQVTENCIVYTNCADVMGILLENGCTLLQ